MRLTMRFSLLLVALYLTANSSALAQIVPVQGFAITYGQSSYGFFPDSGFIVNQLSYDGDWELEHPNGSRFTNRFAYSVGPTIEMDFLSGFEMAPNVSGVNVFVQTEFAFRFDITETTEIEQRFEYSVIDAPSTNFSGFYYIQSCPVDFLGCGDILNEYQVGSELDGSYSNAITLQPGRYEARVWLNHSNFSAIGAGQMTASMTLTPEPSTAMLLGVAIASLRRKRR